LLRNSFCAEAQDRTGDTWFFRRISDASSDYGLNSGPTRNGSARRPLVQNAASERESRRLDYLLTNGQMIS
jgi:hypothetical protein